MMTTLFNGLHLCLKSEQASNIDFTTSMHGYLMTPAPIRGKAIDDMPRSCDIASDLSSNDMILCKEQLKRNLKMVVFNNFVDFS